MIVIEINPAVSPEVRQQPFFSPYQKEITKEEKERKKEKVER